MTGSCASGMWTKAPRPSGWHDLRYSFGADRGLRIYYDTLDPFEGTVLGVDTSNIMVEGARGTGASPEKMTMCYVLDASGASIQLGWYDGIVARYYLKLVKQ